MHYKEYCKVQGVDRASPLVTLNFYQGLNQITLNRSTVLADIEHMSVKRLSKLYETVQRCLDIFLSLMGIFIGAIPFATIAIIIKMDSAGPVFHRQMRVGKEGKVFQILKFRTMCRNAESATGPVWATPEDPRLTRVGAFLRRTRLDELPQLFNILKGDMTFVGPRPERPEFVYWFTKCMPAFDRRHDVKPGIAGMAQLKNGYDDSAKSVYRKLRWDTQYMKTKCLMTDISILYRTVWAVLRGKA